MRSVTKEWRSPGTEAEIAAVGDTVAILPTGEGAVAVDALSADIDTMLTAGAFEARAAIWLANAVITHLPCPTLRVGLADDMATGVDADETGVAFVVEHTLVHQRRIVEADTIDAALPAWAVGQSITFIGAKSIATQLVDTAVTVVIAEVLAHGANTVDARLTGFALFGRAAGHILGFGDTTAVLTGLFPTTVIIDLAEGSALATVTVGVFVTVLILEADGQGDTGSILAAHVIVVAVDVGEALGDAVVDGILRVIVQRGDFTLGTYTVDTDTDGTILVERTSGLAETVGATGGILPALVFGTFWITGFGADTVDTGAIDAAFIVVALSAGQAATVDTDLVVGAFLVVGASGDAEAVETADLVSKTLGAVDASPRGNAAAFVANSTVAVIILVARLRVAAGDLWIAVAVGGAALPIEAVVVLNAGDSATVSPADLFVAADRTCAEILG